MASDVCVIGYLQTDDVEVSSALELQRGRETPSTIGRLAPGDIPRGHADIERPARRVVGRPRGHVPPHPGGAHVGEGRRVVLLLRGVEGVAVLGRLGAVPVGGAAPNRLRRAADARGLLLDAANQGALHAAPSSPHCRAGADSRGRPRQWRRLGLSASTWQSGGSLCPRSQLHHACLGQGGDPPGRGGGSGVGGRPISGRRLGRGLTRTADLRPSAPDRAAISRAPVCCTRRRRRVALRASTRGWRSS